MAARTGEQFLNGLRGDREVWVEGRRVKDVVSHPAFTGAAHALAEVFDLQHKQADRCLMPDPETGEPINASHLIPRSRDDLRKRHDCLTAIAEYSVGLMGRTPDYMNVTYAGFAGRAEEWAINGNEAGAERLVAYQKKLRREDISLTHTIIQPTIDKALGDAPRAGNTVSLRKVGKTANGIVVSGARVLSTLAPFADELAVYPGAPLPEGADDYALSFCIPMSAPGLKFLCRDSYSRASNVFDHPLSSRFDEQDAFVIFDNVEIPYDRLFIDCNLAGLQLRDEPDLVAQHHAADDDPRADEAGVRVGHRHAHGRCDQREPTADTAGARRNLDIRRDDPCMPAGRRRRCGRYRQRRVVAGQAAVHRAARDDAGLDGARERDHQGTRLTQHFHHAVAGRTGRSGVAAAARSSSEGRGRRRRGASCAYIPSGLGLRRQWTRWAQRTIRTFLSRIRTAQLSDGAHDGGPNARERTRWAGSWTRRGNRRAVHSGRIRRRQGEKRWQ